MILYHSVTIIPQIKARLTFPSAPVPRVVNLVIGETFATIVSIVPAAVYLTCEETIYILCYPKTIAPKSSMQLTERNSHN